MLFYKYIHFKKAYKDTKRKEKIYFLPRRFDFLKFKFLLIDPLILMLVQDLQSSYNLVLRARIFHIIKIYFIS